MKNECCPCMQEIVNLKMQISNYRTNAIRSFNKTRIKLHNADANLKVRNCRILHEGLAQIELMEDMGIISETEAQELFIQLTDDFHGIK